MHVPGGGKGTGGSEEFWLGAGRRATRGPRRESSILNHHPQGPRDGGTERRRGRNGCDRLLFGYATAKESFLNPSICGPFTLSPSPSPSLSLPLGMMVRTPSHNSNRNPVTRTRTIHSPNRLPLSSFRLRFRAACRAAGLARPRLGPGPGTWVGTAISNRALPDLRHSSHATDPAVVR